MNNRNNYLKISPNTFIMYSDITLFEKKTFLLEVDYYINYMFFCFFSFLLLKASFGIRRIYLLYNNKNTPIKILQVQEKSTAAASAPIVKFEDKYLKQYKKLESILLSEERLQTLKNTFLFQQTPLGNLIMFYDHSRESFTYYSDNTIPYRFLEVASRHYVIQNNCKSIHVHMPDELLEVEKKLEENKNKEREKEKEKEKERMVVTQNSNDVSQRKSVFAKLKNYNTSAVRAPNATTNHKINANTNGRPMSQTKTNVKLDNNDIIVKEKANRYSCEGKIANFSFLQKVDKKMVDNRYSMSFSDFMKMQNQS